MNAIQELSTIIAHEANDIIYKHGLNDILNKYGETFYTGSYELNLMTWRDLDIYIVNANHTEIKHFELGKEILLAFKPYKMSYRNEIIAKSELLPRGLYWGGVIQTIYFQKIGK